MRNLMLNSQALYLEINYNKHSNIFHLCLEKENSFPALLEI